MTTTMQVTRRTVLPDRAPHEYCEAQTDHATYAGEKVGSGWLCTVRLPAGGGVTLFAGASSELLAEPYASELKAFAAACEASE